MNLIVKRFLVFALPLLMLGSASSDNGYSIQIENNSGIELEDFSITHREREFSFGDLSAGATTALGNADFQFGAESPRELDVAFTPKNGPETIKSTVEIPLLDNGESIQLSISSYLDLIRGIKS